MASSKLLTWGQNNVLWLIQQPRRRLASAGHRWYVTKPATGHVRRITPIPVMCAESLLEHGLVEPCGRKGRRFQISEKGREAYRSGRLSR